MSYKNISAVLKAEDITEIKSAIQTIKDKMPFSVNLTIQERRRLRKMGPGRLGYVQDVHQAVSSNSEILPNSFSLDEYSKDVKLFQDLNEIRSLLIPLYENIDNTYKALGSEMLKQTDECYGYLKLSAQKTNNQALIQTYKTIQNQLKQKKINK